jgi:hypothetical protein
MSFQRRTSMTNEVLRCAQDDKHDLAPRASFRQARRSQRRRVIPYSAQPDFRVLPSGDHSQPEGE